MNFFSFKKFAQYYLPATLSLFMLVTVERTVTTDGGYDRLYGLPLPYITNNFACSFCYAVFVPAVLLNLLFCFAFALSIFTLLQRWGWRLKTHRLFVLAGITVSLFWMIIFVWLTHDSRFLFSNDVAYETKGQRIVFGLRP